MSRKPWTVAAIVVAAIFYAVAISHAIYELTSPTSLSWHVLLRKAYSIAAFAIVGWFLRRALVENGRGDGMAATCVFGVAAYSAAIEVGQYLHGSREGLAWNVFDTCCGAVGGGLAVADRFRPRRSGVPR